MKNKIFNFVWSLLIFFLAPMPALAAGDFGLWATAKQLGYSGSTSITGVIALGLNIFFSFLLVIFLGYALYAGLRWMTARGNEEFVEKARGTLEAAVLGLAIILLSYTLVRFVLGFF